MAEEWLDAEARAVLNRPIIKDPTLDLTPDPPKSPSQRKIYDEEKLKIELPGTHEIERMEYVTTTLNFNSKENVDCGLQPEFIQPKPRFDIFEHFNYEMIPL